MKQRLAIVILFALVVSGAASALLYRLISSQLANNREASGNHIVVAAHTLMSGDLIKDGDVKTVAWSGPVPPGAIFKEEDALNRGVVEAIYEGEGVVESRVAARGAGAGLAATIPPGMRAVAVRVNEVAGISGFAIPGTRVDILIAGNPPNGGNVGTVTKTLLQNIQVLSAGQNIQKDNEGKPVTVAVVNMLVTPEQAEILSLASNEARIQMVLRNPTDKEQTKPPGTAMAYLFNGLTAPADAPVPQSHHAPRVAAPRPPPPPPPVVVVPEPPKVIAPILVEVIHGSKKVETKFQGEEQPNASEGKTK